MKGQPNNIKEFYTTLAKLDSIQPWKIQPKLQIQGEIPTDWKDKIRYERHAFSYNFNKGDLISNSQVVDENGKIVIVPYSESEMAYFVERIGDTDNPWLISRYAHLLWKETKNLEYAKLSIDKYLDAIVSVQGRDVRDVPQVLQAILHLTSVSKHRKKEVKEFTIELIEKVPKWFKVSLIDVTLDSKLFGRKEYTLISNQILDWVDLPTDTDYFGIKKILECTIQLFSRVGRSPKAVYELLAKNVDTILAQHPDDTDFIKHKFTGLKALYHRKAGLIEESEETFKEYTRLKATLKLGKGSVSFDPKIENILDQFLRLKTKAILSMPTEQILSYFAVSSEVLVVKEDLKGMRPDSQSDSIYEMFSTSVLDINNNFKDLSDSSAEDFTGVKNYSLAYDVKCQHLFLSVIADGVLTGKINYYSIYQFLDENTWYGQSFALIANQNQEPIKKKWLSLIAPGIQNLVAQLENSVILQTNEVNNFVLAIDSLTLKFEGAIRDFIKLQGGNTSKVKGDIIQEQLLESLLENEVIVRCFSTDDIEFFKYAFTRNGEDLRNDVAHSFMPFEAYSIRKACLVFLCILKLGKFRLEENESTTQKSDQLATEMTE